MHVVGLRGLPLVVFHRSVPSIALPAWSRSGSRTVPVNAKNDAANSPTAFDTCDPE
jgi:hypothetical protein